MAEPSELFANPTGPDASATSVAALQGTGILPYQQIKALVRDHEIWSDEDIRPEQVQPASFDLRLGRVAYRVRASFLPGEQSSVAEKIQQFALHEIDLSAGAVLEKDCVYVVPIREIKLSAGAEFLVVICGEIMTMPGLPKVPAANTIRLNDRGEVEGLF